MNYKEYQNALKNLRNNGFDVQVKLNAKLDVLKAEYDRLMPETTVEPITADEFNKIVGFPTNSPKASVDDIELSVTTKYSMVDCYEYDLPEDAVQISLDVITLDTTYCVSEVSSPLQTAISPVNIGSEASEALESSQPMALTNNALNFVLEPVQRLQPIQSEGLFYSSSNNSKEPTKNCWNKAKVPDSNSFSYPNNVLGITQQPESLSCKTLGLFHQVSEVLVTKPTTAEAPSPLETIQDESLAPQLTLLPAPKNDNRLLEAPNSALERSKVANHPGYWIDDSRLSERLESTQVQAIRNLEEGWRSLKQLGRNLQSFRKGFDDGLRQADKTPVSALKSNNVIGLSMRMLITA